MHDQRHGLDTYGNVTKVTCISVFQLYIYFSDNLYLIMYTPFTCYIYIIKLIPSMRCVVVSGEGPWGL